MHRAYHEIKAQRCQQNLVWLKNKLHRLEGIRVKKIDDLKAEIKAIEDSIVTLRCETCNRQFTIPFSKYVKGDYKKLCKLCKKAENDKCVKHIESVLKDANIKYEHRYCSPDIRIELPHKDVW